MMGPTHRLPRPVVEAIRGRLDTLSDRFWAKVPFRPVEPDECWPWRGCQMERGYGQIDKVLAHRVAYYLATGEDPGERDVMHSCDNPPCVRPSHLSLGTHADNMADAATKGRMPGRPTLTEAQIAEARRLYAEEGLSTAQVAERVGASGAHVARLVQGVSTAWKATGWKRQPGMKLTDEQVEEIRTRYAAGGITQRALAAEYGIDQGYLCALVKGRERKRGAVA